jgi:hypothetical protein
MRPLSGTFMALFQFIFQTFPCHYNDLPALPEGRALACVMSGPFLALHLRSWSGSAGQRMKQ